jgi:N-acetylmuramic acid 6-phosphate etherase
VERAKRIIVLATGVTYEQAAGILEESGGHVKTAIVMAARGVPPGEARERIERAGGTVREAIAIRP